MGTYYDYKCPNCDRKVIGLWVEDKNEKVKCKQCGDIMSKLVYPGCPALHIFPSEGVHLEHVSAEGKTFYSKKEMVKYARKNNLDLGYLG